MNLQVNMMIGQGIEAFQKGDLSGAELILKRVLQVYPSTYPALQILGLIKASQENHLEAVVYFKKALKLESSDPGLLNNLAQALLASGNFSEAIPHLERITKLVPNNAGTWFNLGRALFLMGRCVEALKSLDHALRIDPNNQEALITKAWTLRDSGLHEQAVEVFRVVLAADQKNFAAWLDLAYSLGELGYFEEAILANERAIAVTPNDGNAWCNQGVYLLALKRFEEALLANEKAIEFNPNHPIAWLNKGAALRHLRRYEEALIATDKSIELASNNPGAWLNIGALFRDLKKHEMSLDAFEKSLKLDPDNPQAWFNKGLALGELGQNTEAILVLNEALKLGATNEMLKGYLIHKKMQIADWFDIESQLNAFLAGLRNGVDSAEPFLLLSLFDDPGLHLEVSRRLADIAVTKGIPEIKVVNRARNKIRIGYFSSDLRGHPVGMLIPELIERHNRDEFEVYGFSLQVAKSGDKVRERLVGAFDRFIELDGLPEKDMILQSREHELDIAIDLNGFTEGNRTPIFAHRVAPVQVNFLGYPGTMGAEFMDYVIADQGVIPVEFQKFYAEKVAYLPNAYLMYDTTQKIPSAIPSRLSLGIPENAFVFCALHNGYKVSKEVLESWANILRSVQGSVLWMSENNATFKKNILDAFSVAGINQERIIFAPRVDNFGDHLARLQQADLYLDAWPYNAHSTAMDALNVGLPILTKVGQSFASRVGASLLSTLELQELIATSREEYEEKATKLAGDLVRLRECKNKILSEDARAKLFNMEAFASDLEALCKQMHQRAQHNLSPEHLRVFRP